MNSSTVQSLKSFAEFYPYYLGEHANRICRRLHFIGSLGVLALTEVDQSEAGVVATVRLQLD